MSTFIEVHTEDEGRCAVNLDHLTLVEWQDKDGEAVSATLCLTDGTDLVVTDRSQLNGLADALARHGGRR